MRFENLSKIKGDFPFFLLSCKVYLRVLLEAGN